MKQKIVHGAFIDALTADEFYAQIKRPVERTRMRAGATTTLDAAGGTGGPNNPLTVYKVPIGAEFEIRRIFVNLGNVTGATLATASITLNSPGNYVSYYRSGTLIEYGAPASSAGIKVPGVQTWGDQQGPYLRNGEVFAVDAGLGAPSANQTLIVLVEGILTVNRADA